MDDWPLSVRSAGGDPRFEQLHEDVPEWLFEPLGRWLRPAFGQGRWQDELVSAVQTGLRVVVPRQPRRVVTPGASYRFNDLMTWAGPSARLLDVVDWVVQRAPHLLLDMDTTPQDEVAQLESLLRTGGSAWMVAPQGEAWLLQRRVGPATTAQLGTAVTAAGDADGHLERAWVAAFGRHPDPSGAYREAVNAVEHVACPLVVHNDTAATLGKVIGQLRAGGWATTFRVNPTKTPALPPIGTVAAMCELLWNSDPRHGNDSRGVPTLGEAQAAAHLAVLLVCWFTDGTIHTP